jgi:uncharacterized membrane protein
MSAEVRVEQAAAPPVADARVRRAELLISTLLRLGVLASVILVVSGVAVMLAEHPSYVSSPDALSPLRSGAVPFPASLSGLIAGISRFDGESIAAAGLLTLVLTPLIRVAVSIAIFAFNRDRLFAAITSAVLGLLLLSLVLGRAGG